ncbi:hypothetical protein ABDI16_24120, partial [Cytobacillus firmus]
DDLYYFNEWCRWKGTPYEEGIDDQTKIARLLEEINDLQSEVSALKKEKENLELRLGINPFLINKTSLQQKKQKGWGIIPKSE